MTKQKRQFLVLLVFLVLCVIAYYFVSKYEANAVKQGTEEETEITVAQIDPDKIQAFSYIVDQTTYSYTKEDDKWVCENDKSLKLDKDAVQNLLTALKSVAAKEKLESYDSLSDYGLDQPSNTITVSDGEETTTFYIGNYNDMMQEYYLKIEGDDAVFLTDATLSDTFSVKPDSLVEQEDAESTE